MVMVFLEWKRSAARSGPDSIHDRSRCCMPDARMRTGAAYRPRASVPWLVHAEWETSKTCLCLCPSGAQTVQTQTVIFKILKVHLVQVHNLTCRRQASLPALLQVVRLHIPRVPVQRDVLVQPAGRLEQYMRRAGGTCGGMAYTQIMK